MAGAGLHLDQFGLREDLRAHLEDEVVALRVVAQSAEGLGLFEAVTRFAAGSLRSPLLRHPLAEQAGGDFFHSGGKHWDSQSDPEWQTLKAWVTGAKAP